NPIQSQGHAQAQLAIPALPQSPIQGQGKNRAASQLGGKDGADGDIGDTGTSRANDAAAPVSLRALALALAPNAQASPLPVRAGGPSLAARNPCIDGVAVPDGALPDADP
ncbi:MAG TPA: hypothetical protein DCW29_23420, partial [Janthinobacterium sp.]|nr:hypothetical protein [Janthinobacterium sp.]